MYKLGYINTLNLLVILSALGSSANKDVSRGSDNELLDKEYGVRYASSCEACKYMSIELQEQFDKLGDTNEVIETGYRLDGPKKKTKYTKSDLYLIEAIDNVCERLLEYNIHKERKDSNRFAKGRSQTFNTLHGLADKGVKVDLGIPKELWDSPPAEITSLKQTCEDLIEKYEDIVEQWYHGDRDRKLIDYMCRDRVLNKEELSCLDDPPPPSTTLAPSSTTSVSNADDKHEDQIPSSHMPDEL